MSDHKVLKKTVSFALLQEVIGDEISQNQEGDSSLAQSMKDLFKEKRKEQETTIKTPRSPLKRSVTVTDNIKSDNNTKKRPTLKRENAVNFSTYKENNGNGK